jgi:heme/copper-type cytochrome/quinol oxidase subunit 3
MISVPWAHHPRPDTRTTNVRLGLWLFLASEAMLFGSLVSAYVLLRTGVPMWPDDGLVTNAWLPTLETILLVAATACLPSAEASGRAVRVRVTASALLASAFVVVKVSEYVSKLGAGLHPSANIALACWFVLTGVHAVHVVGGIAADLWIVATAARVGPAQQSERIYATRLYWLFVDLVWLVILVSFYLI